MSSDLQGDANAPDRRPAALMRLLRVVGSLWFGAVLLMLLVVAMGFATVFESMRGTSQALGMFYKSSWFTALLVIGGVNMFASMVSRLPVTRRNLGFMLTHVGIVTTLIGAGITYKWGVDGRIGMYEGDSVTSYVDSYVQTVAVAPMSSNEEPIRIDLPAWLGRTYRVLDRPALPSLRVGDTEVTVARYLPDGAFVVGMENNAPTVEHAVEVTLEGTNGGMPTWLMADSGKMLHGHQTLLQIIQDQAAFDRACSDTRLGRPGETDVLRITSGDQIVEVPVRACRAAPVPVGQTGLSVQVLRYFWSASVERGVGIWNASPEPRNPMVEVELTGPAGKEVRRCFAKFPDFGMGHRQAESDEVKVVYVANAPAAGPAAPIEVLLHPQSGQLAARFCRDGFDPVTEVLALGAAVDTPWEDHRFRVLRHFDHAREADDRYEPIDPPREAPQPVLQLAWAHRGEPRTLWLPKYTRKVVTIDNTNYGVSYIDKEQPLGFKITLNDFEIGRYPGTMRPRTFESTVTMIEPHTGLEINRVISMNNPATFGGFTLFQSSYREDEQTGRTASFLALSRDPGVGIVYAGYIITTIGMVIGLATIGSRAHRRHAGQQRAAGPC